MTRWNAYIEYAATDVPDAVHDAVYELLTDHGGAPTTADNGNFAILVTLDAPTTEQAITTALNATGSALQQAYGLRPVAGVEVITEDEQIRRATAAPLVPELAGRAEVARILDVSPSSAGQTMRTKRFQEHAPLVQELAAGPVFLAAQVRNFAEIRNTLPGPKQPR